VKVSGDAYLSRKSTKFHCTNTRRADKLTEYASESSFTSESRESEGYAARDNAVKKEGKVSR